MTNRERLTDRRTAEQVRENIEKLQAAGFEVSIGDLRYVRLAEYENKERRNKRMAEYLSEKDMNTGEYISREELLKSLTQECKDCEHDDPYWCEQCDFAIAMLYARHEPKADVQPVRFARWIDLDNRILCSGCGAGYDDYDEVKQNTYIFCPNCGARMKED